jgi:hypothetical protein
MYLCMYVRLEYACIWAYPRMHACSTNDVGMIATRLFFVVWPSPKQVLGLGAPIKSRSSDSSNIVKCTQHCRRIGTRSRSKSPVFSMHHRHACGASGSTQSSQMLAVKRNSPEPRKNRIDVFLTGVRLAPRPPTRWHARYGRCPYERWVSYRSQCS